MDQHRTVFSNKNIKFRFKFYLTILTKFCKWSKTSHEKRPSLLLKNNFEGFIIFFIVTTFTTMLISQRYTTTSLKLFSQNTHTHTHTSFKSTWTFFWEDALQAMALKQKHIHHNLGDDLWLSVCVCVWERERERMCGNRRGGWIFNEQHLESKKKFLFEKKFHIHRFKESNQSFECAKKFVLLLDSKNLWFDFQLQLWKNKIWSISFGRQRLFVALTTTTTSRAEKNLNQFSFRASKKTVLKTRVAKNGIDLFL